MFFLFSICLDFRRRWDNRERKEIEIELTTPVNCVRTRVSLCKKQNDVRVLNDVVCLTICVGIYEQQEREREKEKTNFYILYIYIAMQYNAFSELNEFYRVLISFQIEWMDGKTKTKKQRTNNEIAVSIICV